MDGDDDMDPVERNLIFILRLMAVAVMTLAISIAVLIVHVMFG
jgi:hypothetical protein